jgi:hypothetical protein
METVSVRFPIGEDVQLLCGSRSLAVSFRGARVSRTVLADPRLQEALVKVVESATAEVITWPDLHSALEGFGMDLESIIGAAGQDGR